VTLSIVVPTITTSSESLIYTGIYGASSVSSQTVSMAMNNGAAVNWTATAGATWLGLSPTSGTTPDTLTVSINPSGLAVGTHTSTITITGSGLSGPTTINVTLNLFAPTMSVTPGSLSFGGVNGGLDASGKTVQINLNTGTNAYAWSASSPDAWLRILPAAGSVSAAPATVTVTVNPTGLTEGTHTGSIAFTALVNGVTVNRTLPVDLRLNAHKILSSDAGVALTSTPSLSKLTQTLRVRSNRGATINWSAVSDQAWLLVTPSGTTAESLVVTAAPGVLAADTIHYANISITSDDVSVQNTETVRVGLWVGSNTPATTTNISTPQIQGRANQAVADPIRPYLYYHDGGTNISVYNVYTGSVVATIASVASHLGEMAVANDGSRLYVLNNALFTIIPIDLSTLIPGTAWSFGNQVYTYLDYVRTDGVGLVISGNGQIFNAVTGVAYSTGFYVAANGNSIVKTSQDGSRFCTLDVSYVPYTVVCYPLFYSTTNSGEVMLGASRSTQGAANTTGNDLAVSNDGGLVYVPSHIYNSASGPNDIKGYDASSMLSTMPEVRSFPIGTDPNNVEVARDGRVFAGRYIWDAGADVRIYNSSGTELGSYDVSGSSQALFTGRLRLSGDGLRMITITGTSSRISTIGP